MFLSLTGIYLKIPVDNIYKRSVKNHTTPDIFKRNLKSGTKQHYTPQKIANLKMEELTVEKVQLKLSNLTSLE